MSSDGSVTHWIQLLQAGDDSAVREIWERYFRRLVGLAREKLRRTRCGAADEEDVALSVFDSFCRGLEEGRFPNLQDRDNLWKVLVVLTARKALRLVQYERRQKRGGGKVLAEADLSPVGENERRYSTASSAESQALSLPRRWPRSAIKSWHCWATIHCARSHAGRWKATPMPRLPSNSIVWSGR